MQLARSVTISRVLLLGTVLVALPVTLDPVSLAPDLSTAYAEPGGNGGGGGADGGNDGGGGNGGGSGNGGGNAGGNGNGNAGGGASGQANAGGKSADADLADLGNSAASRGSLNAGHASPTAMDSAAPNSVPGQIGSYRDAIQDGDLEAAAAALAEASNRDLTQQSVASLNGLIGLDLDPAIEAALADRANELR